MTLKETISGAQRRLREVYPEGEAKAMVREIFFRLKGYTLADLLLKAEEEVSDYIGSKVTRIVDRLAEGEPIQYIFGQARFYGMDFKVTPDTLIPRRETEELVDLVVRRWRGESDLKVLDVCTGSGCIAVALARNLPFSKVEGLDISGAALVVARENATTLKVKVDFYKADALRLDSSIGEGYDIVISNPPYVLESEKAEMSKNVLDHEPPLALFVPDSDPVKFYTAIAAFASEALRPGGMLYFEINPLEVDNLRKIGDDGCWSDSEFVRDISGKERFMILTKRG